MKTQKIYWLGIVILACSLTACTPQEEDVHPKRRSSRTENLKRYMPKAQELRAQVQLRAKSIVNGPLLTAEDVKPFIHNNPQVLLSSYLQAQQQALQSSP